MRRALVPMFLLLANLRADACPRDLACVAVGPRVDAAEIGGGKLGDVEAVAPATALALAIELAIAKDMDIDIDHTRAVHQLDHSLRTHVVPRATGTEMPWIWRVLRSSVYSRMPRYERVAVRQPAHNFSLVLSPVVVTSPQDTVPGVGIEGGF